MHCLRGGTKYQELGPFCFTLIQRVRRLYLTCTKMSNRVYRKNITAMLSIKQSASRLRTKKI